jgi:hypothetical protein
MSADPQTTPPYIQELIVTLRMIALESHECIFAEPVNWEEVANTMTGLAKTALRNYEATHGI